MAPPPPPPFNFTISPTLSPFAIPMSNYLTTHPIHSLVGSGVLVFARNRVLLLQRASHDSMPNRWETPGGAVDVEDATILHGVARELWEESGLTVTAIKQQVGEGHVFRSRRGLGIVKFTFLVDVEGTDVVLDPNEHQRFVWAGEEECRQGRMGDADGNGNENGLEIEFTSLEQKKTILEGFRVWKMNGDGV